MKNAAPLLQQVKRELEEKIDAVDRKVDAVDRKVGQTRVELTALINATATGLEHCIDKKLAALEQRLDEHVSKEGIHFTPPPPRR